MVILHISQLQICNASLHDRPEKSIYKQYESLIGRLSFNSCRNKFHLIVAYFLRYSFAVYKL